MLVADGIPRGRGLPNNEKGTLARATSGLGASPTDGRTDERMPTRVLMTDVDLALMTDAITTNALRADGELGHAFDCNAAIMLGVSRC